VGYGLLFHEVLWSHTLMRHSLVGLPWTSDQLVSETSTWQHTTDKHPYPWWDSNSWLQQAIGHRPTP
jgi:hypothetical protein